MVARPECRIELHPTGRGLFAITLPRMKLAREVTYGIATPPLLHRWMHAVLLLCAELVHSAVSTLWMICARLHRDWHTMNARKALPHATSGIESQEQTLQLPFSGTRKTHIPGIPIVSAQGTTPHSRATSNHHARIKTGHDSISLARSASVFTHAPLAKAGSPRRYTPLPAGSRAPA